MSETNHNCRECRNFIVVPLDDYSTSVKIVCKSNLIPVHNVNLVKISIEGLVIDDRTEYILLALVLNSSHDLVNSGVIEQTQIMKVTYSETSEVGSNRRVKD